MSDGPAPSVEAIRDVAPFEVRRFRAGREEVIAITGELDLATVGSLETSLAAAYATGPDRIVLDLTELEFADSTGLKVIIQAHQRIGDRLVFVRGPRQIDRLFELCGFDGRLVFVDRAPDAEDADRDARRISDGRHGTVRRVAHAALASAIRDLRTSRTVSSVKPPELRGQR